MLACYQRKCKYPFATAADLEENTLPPVIWATCIDL